MPSKITPEQLIAIALAHHRAGRLAEAEGIYRKLLAANPANARALDLLGVLTLQMGRPEIAAIHLGKAVAREPLNAGYQCNWGESLRRCGRYDEAIAALTEAIRLNPHLPVAHNNLGIALAESGRAEEAITTYRRAIALKPDHGETIMNLANVLNDAGRSAEALLAAEQSVSLEPASAMAHNTLGVVLAAAGRLGEAIEAYRKSISLNPIYADAHSNLGNVLAADGQHGATVAASRRAVELDPDSVQSHWNYAVMLLRTGDLPSGWREYEWRWRWQSRYPRPKPRYHPPRFPTPHWAGGDLTGKTIFLHAEQGFGDTIHFARYAPLLAARGARVILECQPELRRLFESLQGVSQLIVRGEEVPPFDVHCPLMSLPLAFGTTLATIPAHVPYLCAGVESTREWRELLDSGSLSPVLRGEGWGEGSEVGNRNRWRTLTPGLSPQPSPPSTGEREQEADRAKCGLVGSASADAVATPVARGALNPLATEQPSQYENVNFSTTPTLSIRLGRGIAGTGKPLRVGLCWAGSPNHADDVDRSIPLAMFAPLALPGVEFHCLQKGPAAAQSANPPTGMVLIDHGEQIGDFADTAALIANLDLVITVDTAVGHLAGALGKPVWVLIRSLPDWRWLIDRTDSPWYPMMRLFRQRQRGNWGEVIARVGTELTEWASRP